MKLLFLILSFLCSFCVYGQRYQFEWIGDLPGGAVRSKAYAVSDDGEVITGISYNDLGNQAFRWQNGQTISLGDLYGIGDSVGYAVNFDGTIISGNSGMPIGGREACVWQSDEIIGMGFLASGINYSYGSDISDNGTIVGQSANGFGYKAFIWQDNVMSALPDLDGAFSIASAITNNGQYIVGGAAMPSSNVYLPMRWINQEGPFPLGLPGVEGTAYGVSDSGELITGYAVIDGYTQMFLWSESTGMVGLGDLPGGTSNSRGWGISGSGNRIVGFGYSSLGKEAVFWDEENGLKNLQDFLNEHCVDMSNVASLSEARGISDDGTIIVGFGFDTNGNSLAFRARISNSTISADLDEDNDVDITDAGLFLRSFGSYEGESNFSSDCDFNCDGTITVDDLSLFFSFFGLR